MNISKIAAFACAFVLTGASQSASTDFRAVGQLIERRLHDTHAPSLAVSVSRHGVVVWEQAFGFADTGRRIAATPETPYALASVTKSFTALGVQIAAERGLLELDAPVNTYLRGAQLRSYRWTVSDATLRRVAQHRGGLTTYFQYCQAGMPGCRSEMNRTISRYGVVFWKPGTVFDYSNLGYGVLGDVLQNVSGMSYARFIDGNIFAPLGMRHSFVADGAFPQFAAPRYVDGIHPVSRYVEFTPGASSAYASAHDLGIFGRFMLKDRGIRAHIVSDAALDEIENRTVKGPSPYRYGLGWWVQDNQFGYRVVYAQGGASGDNAALVLIPSQDIAVAVVANSDTISTLDTAGDILAAMLPAYAQGRRSAATPPPPSAARRPLSGTWRGFVYTYRRALSVTLATDPVPSIKIGNGPAYPLTAVTFRRHLQGRTRGALHLDEIPDGAYDIDFDLAPDGNGFYGAFTTDPHRGAANAGLSFWVRLVRSSPRTSDR